MSEYQAAELIQVLKEIKDELRQIRHAVEAIERHR